MSTSCMTEVTGKQKQVHFVGMGRVLEGGERMQSLNVHNVLKIKLIKLSTISCASPFPKLKETKREM